MKGNKKLIVYIKKNLDAGINKEKIKEKVIQSGYSEEMVDKIFIDIETPKKRWFQKIRFELKKPKDIEPIQKEIVPVLTEEQKKELKEDVNPIVMDTPNEKQGLKSTLEEVNKKLDVITNRNKKTAYKEFSLPSQIKRQLKKLALKNKILVILLTRNRGMIPMVTEIKDGFVNIEGTPHQCAVDQVFLWKGKYPAMVIPEWDIRPIGTQDYYDAVKNNTIADPIAIAIRMIENKENIMKNKMSSKTWIFIGLAAIAGIWILFGGG